MDASIAYIGLGSNLSSPSEQLDNALLELHKHANIDVIVCSHLYGSSPMGPQDQPDYTNAVCKLSTTLSPLDLLDVTQQIELNQGRKRNGERWGPRTLDLDILLFSDMQVQNERLTIPHYGMATREFVLVPLFEIEPDLIMPDQRLLSAWVAECSLIGLSRQQAVCMEQFL